MSVPITNRSMRIAALGMLLALSSLNAVPAVAQDAAAPHAQAESATAMASLPPDRRTRHTITVSGRS